MKLRLIGLFLILLLVACGSADIGKSTTEVIAEFAEAVNSGEIGAAMQLLTDDVGGMTIDNEPIVGKEAVESHIQKMADSGGQMIFKSTVDRMGQGVEYRVECTIMGDGSVHDGYAGFRDGLISSIVLCPAE